MTILFDATRPVKTARRKSFAIGVTRPNRERRAPYTAADAAWWAANAPSNPTGYEVNGIADSIIDQAAGEAAALDRMEAGCPAF